MKNESGKYKLINGKHCFSTQGICSILQISRETLANWADQGCPKLQRGWWDLNAVLAWSGVVSSEGVKSRNEAKTDKQKKSTFEKKLYAEAELKEEQLNALKIKNGITQGEYIAKNELIKELTEFMFYFKKSLQNLTSVITGEISHYVEDIEARRIESLISKLINNALAQMCINGVYNGKKH